MQLHIKKLTGKLGFLAAIAAAAVIGGVSTGVVMASIPDSNGNLQTCYRNNGGDLRVIDTATQTCANNETAFNLSQAVTNSSTAYFRVTSNNVDTAALRNIEDYEWYDGTGTSTDTGYCLEVNFTPHMAFSNTLTNSISPGIDPTADISDRCASNFNVFLYSDVPQTHVDLWLSK